MPPEPNDGASGSRPGQRENTLRLSDRRLDEVLDRLDAQPGNSHSDRQHFRFPFRRSAIPIRIDQPAGRPLVMHVACRNISRTGLSFLHNAFVHLNRRCAIGLVTLDRQAVRIDGTVMRCIHRFDHIHEIGVKFDQEIDVRRFRPMNPLDPLYSLEKIDAKGISGRVLHVEDWEFDRSVLRHVLKETQVRIVEAESVQDAKQKLEESFDLILCDVNLKDGTAEDIVVHMRDQGLATPIVLIAETGSDNMKSRVSEMSVDGVLTKPLDQEHVLRAAAEFLVVPKQAEGEGPRARRKLQSPELTRAFKDYLPAQQVRLEEALAANDVKLCAQVCTELRSSAATLGFSQIEQLSKEACDVMARTGRAIDAAASIKSLLACCQRMGGRQAA